MAGTPRRMMHSMHYCAIATTNVVRIRALRMRTLRLRLRLFADDYLAILTFDGDVRCTRVKLDDEDLRRNYMMHHMVRRGRGWVGDRCLKLAVLEMSMPSRRWTNSLMCKYCHQHHCQCCSVSLVNYFVQVHRHHLNRR